MDDRKTENKNFNQIISSRSGMEYTVCDHRYVSRLAWPRARARDGYTNRPSRCHVSKHGGQASPSHLSGTTRDRHEQERHQPASSHYDPSTIHPIRNATARYLDTKCRSNTSSNVLSETIAGDRIVPTNLSFFGSEKPNQSSVRDYPNSIRT